jgi:hypothetical protein
MITGPRQVAVGQVQHIVIVRALVEDVESLLVSLMAAYGERRQQYDDGDDE